MHYKYILFIVKIIFPSVMNIKSFYPPWESQGGEVTAFKATRSRRLRQTIASPGKQRGVI